MTLTTVLTIAIIVATAITCKAAQNKIDQRRAAKAAADYARFIVC